MTGRRGIWPLVKIIRRFRRLTTDASLSVASMLEVLLDDDSSCFILNASPARAFKNSEVVRQGTGRGVDIAGVTVRGDAWRRTICDASP